MTTPTSDAFASLDELKHRLDWTLSVDEERIGEAALEDLSNEARMHGRDWPDPVKAPRMLKTLVLKAAQRYMRNPEGYVQSRAGDETVSWSDNHAPQGSAEFSSTEIMLIERLAGKTGGTIGSAPVVAGDGLNKYRTGYRDLYDDCPSNEGYVPVVGGGKGFPLFRSDESPW